MKKILIFIIALGLFTRCGEDFIEVPVNGVLEISTAFNTPDDAKMLVTGCYDILQQPWTMQTQWLLGDLCAENAWKGGDGPGDNAEFTPLMYFTAGTNNNFVQYMWNSHWMGIYRCNLALQEIPKISGVEPNLQQRYLAEAKFLRAFLYFGLIRNFGDLPIITTPIAIGEYDQPRQPKRKVYDELIEKDLKEIAEILPQKSEYHASDMGRATRGAALALLTKAHLYQEEWNDAYTTAGTVISEGEYWLQSDFRDIFRISHPNGCESIFEVQASNNQSFNEGTFLTKACRNRLDGGWGWFLPSTYLLKSFEPGDPRKDLTVTTNDAMYVEGYDIPYTMKRGSDGNLVPYTMNYKQYIPPLERPANEEQRTDYDYKLIRYADLLLMRAEAANELGMNPDALSALEEVRGRARNMQTDITVLPEVVSTDQVVVRDAIRHERHIELAMEFERFYDIVRWGIAKQELDKFVDFNMNSTLSKEEHPEQGDNKGSLFKVGKHELFAIPEKDVKLAGWQNNPGY